MPKERSTTKSQSGRKDTFDQIMLMLILAFSFRVFVVEAFVIPTGSMAPTLKGAHARFVCDNCGYHYDVNYSPPGSSGGDINIGRVARNETYDVFCPNCGYDQITPSPRVYYGDRILVLKYAYLMRAPRRWDVVVFKTPSDPQINKYSQAYIKRLIGTPGEQVMILDGDIYVAHTAGADATDADWRIQGKPDYVQDALWRVVNDMDYAPQGLSDPKNGQGLTPEDYVPWKTADASWRYSRDATGARALLFGDTAGTGTVRFDHTVGRYRQPLKDFIAYDQHVPSSGGMYIGQRVTEPVGDLKLSMFYTRQAGSGPLELRLSKRNDLFTAVIDPNKISLYRSSLQTPEKRELLAQAPHSFSTEPAKIDFINVDYHVRLRIDGKDVLSTTPEQYSPDVAALRGEVTQPPMPTVGITASQQVCSLTHVSLWRDTYYTQQDVRGNRIARGGPDNPVKLGKEEYFCLGDNSPLSADGRFWGNSVRLDAEAIDAQAGVVPERFMLGKAFVVYWPAGFRLYTDNAPDLIPDFGDMRFIH
jgi:signal peptidase I